MTTTDGLSIYLSLVRCLSGLSRPCRRYIRFREREILVGERPALPLPYLVGAFYLERRPARQKSFRGRVGRFRFCVKRSASGSDICPVTIGSDYDAFVCGWARGGGLAVSLVFSDYLKEVPESWCSLEHCGRGFLCQASPASGVI